MHNITPYSSPTYFIYLLLLLLPIIIGLYNGKRYRIYETLATVVILITAFFGGNMSQGISLIAYIVFEMFLVLTYLRYRTK